MTKYNISNIYNADAFSSIDTYSLFFNIPPIIENRNIVTTAITGFEDFTIPIGFSMVEIIESVIGKKIANFASIIQIKTISLPIGSVQILLNKNKILSCNIKATCNYIHNTGREVSSKSDNESNNCGQHIELLDFVFY